MTEIIEESVRNLNAKIKFIKAVNRGEIDIINKPKDDIYTDMINIDISKYYFTEIMYEITIFDFTKEGLEAMEKTLKDFQEMLI